MVKNLSANVGDAGDVGLIPLLGRSLEKEMGTHSSILTWKIPWSEESGGLQSLKLQKSQTCLSTHTQWDSVHFHCRETATTINL